MSYSNFNTFKLFQNVGINSSSNYVLSMESTGNNVSFHSSNSIDYNNVDIMSIKNIINKKQNMDLNLSSLNGTTINPVITINNTHSDCRIMTNLNVVGNVNISKNLNVSGNLNVNSSGCINLPVGITSSRPSNPNPGAIRYNNETHNVESYSGYGSGSWVNLSGSSSLYDFSSHTFTSAGVTGRTGPSLNQLINAYFGNLWTIHLEYFNVVYGGYQIWTVPKTGNYRIKAYGAAGGAEIETQYENGKGAVTQGEFFLNMGTKMMIIVGQQGETPTGGAGSGGGATWVLGADKWEAIDSNLYCVAGGGGGENDTGNATSITSITVENAGIVQNPLVTNWSSNQSLGSSGYGSCGGGSYGIIGGAVQWSTHTSSSGGSPYDSTLCVGGESNYSGYGQAGGFGGGGTGQAHEAGGGGGYVGGNSSQNYLNEGGHGGSSRNNGNEILFANHSGSNGAVEITFIQEISTSSLYDFTSFTFTNCGATGQNGPDISDAESAYTDAWTDNDAYFNVVQGIQYWTVPKSGNYKIKAYGATASYQNGGKGAIIGGDFKLVRGEIIRILVGQKSKIRNSNDIHYNTGSGGTFVVKAPYNTDTSILVIAGGGGGNGDGSSYPEDLNKHGQFPVVGGPGGAGVYLANTSSAPVYNISGGVNGSAGTIGKNFNAGAGFYVSVNGDSGAAKAFTDTNTPGRGGKISEDNSEGGFGGGGVAGTRGGGGGGYSGGGGASGEGSSSWQGGGGGSYNNGFNQTASVGVTNGWDDHGQVEITFIPEFPIAPTPLYNFTSQTFGNYGALGRTGPTLTQARDELDGAPTWKDNLAFFDVVSGIQYWTVPKSGNYTIKAYGADARVKGGGWGAIVTGTFSLVRGEIIRILVGQRPEPYTNTNGGGGAGGTFVVKAPYNTDDSILVIAGGAGGGDANLTYPDSSLLQNANGQIVTSGGNGSNSTSNTVTFGVPGGTNGYGGQVEDTNHGNRSGGGAGFYGNGSAALTTWGQNEIAQAFVSVTPGLGAEKTYGTVTSNFGEGGFGGGGRIGQTNGGGGGGYSGGGGSSQGNGPWTGGGGGSYNNDSSGTAVTGETDGHLGQGKVEITFIS